MTHIEAMKQALEALERIDEAMPFPVGKQAITSLRQAIAEAEKQEPVSVKHMMEWVAFLKARSDNGQHKQIPSNLSAGACWDLAVELEQFINTHPQPKADQYEGAADHQKMHDKWKKQQEISNFQQPKAEQETKREWVGLTDEQIKEMWLQLNPQSLVVFARAIEAKLKEKNT